MFPLNMELLLVSHAVSALYSYNILQTKTWLDPPVSHYNGNKNQADLCNIHQIRTTSQPEMSSRIAFPRETPIQSKKSKRLSKLIT